MPLLDKHGRPIAPAPEIGGRKLQKLAFTATVDIAEQAMLTLEYEDFRHQAGTLIEITAARLLEEIMAKRKAVRGEFGVDAS